MRALIGKEFEKVKCEACGCLIIDHPIRVAWMCWLHIHTGAVYGEGDE